MITPEVGMGATKLWYSDRTPFTVIEVKNSKRIVVQMDKVKSNGNIEQDENGSIYELSLRKNNRWVEVGQRKEAEFYMLNTRYYYQDPHF